MHRRPFKKKYVIFLFLKSVNILLICLVWCKSIVQFHNFVCSDGVLSCLVMRNILFVIENQIIRGRKLWYVYVDSKKTFFSRQGCLSPSTATNFLNTSETYLCAIIFNLFSCLIIKDKIFKLNNEQIVTFLSLNYLIHKFQSSIIIV